MAREQRRDVDYFPHQCFHGRKMHIIQTRYGNNGYAVWFKLLEQLGGANNHYLDISDEMNFMFLVSVLMVDEEVAKNILNDLAKLGAIDQFLYEKHQIIYSEKLVESIKDAYRKRKSDPFEYSDLLSHLGINNPQSGGRKKQTTGSKAEVIPKEEKSKEKKRKGENITRAYELIKNQKPSEINIFEMQNKKQVKKWRDLVEAFNDKMDIEVSQGKIEWKVDQLFPRLRSWTRSWISNENDKKEKRTPKPDSYESGKQKRF